MSHSCKNGVDGCPNRSGNPFSCFACKGWVPGVEERATRDDRNGWKTRALGAELSLTKAEAKVRELTAHIRRLEEELGHHTDPSGAV